MKCKGKKMGIALTGLAAAAAGYSFLPSQWGKMNHRMQAAAERSVKEAICSADEQKKELYLTFDDGPHPVYTQKLLELLERFQIQATFFVVAKFAEENPELIRKMDEQGHTVGLHSYEHRSAMVQTPGYTRMDFEKSVKIMKSLGIMPTLYRPPWGHVNWVTLQQIQKYHLKKILWDVMVQDWESDSDAQVMQYRLLKKAKPGSIICLHDGRGENHAPQRMLLALEQTIPVWLEEGYSFKPLK